MTESRKIAAERESVAKELQTLIDTANAPIFGVDIQVYIHTYIHTYIHAYMHTYIP